MASPLHVVAGALVALLVWTTIGWPFARRLFGPTLALPSAAVIGWAVHDVFAVVAFRFVPFGTAAIVAIAAVIACAGVVVTASLATSAERGAAADDPLVPPVAWLAAALLAALVTAALLPKIGADGVALGEQIFDHSKIALVDDIVRLGMPPGNPFIAPEHVGDGLSYYYLWHFSAAQLARALAPVFPISGWEADAAMTFFAAFTSLAVAMAVAVRGARHPGAALLVVVLAAASSSRLIGVALFGGPTFDAWIESPGGFGGWLFQSAWVPQHLVSTACVVLALLVIERLARGVSAGGVAALAVLAAAAFESSTWVGGVVFAVVCLFVVPWSLLQVGARRRATVLAALVIGGAGAIALAWPFVVDQWLAAATRQSHAPIVLHPFPVLGPAIPAELRAWLDWPAFFVLMLPIEWTAAFLFGMTTIVATLFRAKATRDGALATLAVATLAALLAASLLKSTLADNNDLGWRAALLSSVLLIPFAAIGVMRAIEGRRRMVVALAAVTIGLGMPEAALQIGRNLAGRHDPANARLVAAPAAWAAVRAWTAPDERVANDPLALATATPWAVNLGWSLFADRRSCYAAWELTQVYSSVPHERLRAIDRRFVRVFAGDGSAEDVHALATTHDCAVVLVTPDDGAWSRDPFAKSVDYRRVEERPGWRIYRRR